MTVEDPMTIDERRKFLFRMQQRYRAAGRVEKGRLLDEMVMVTGQHRKHLIRLMGSELARQPRQRERGACYGPEVGRVVAVVAESLDWVCAERLTPNLKWLAEHLAAQGELELSANVLFQLEAISVSTVRRLLARLPRERPRLPRGGPEQANRLARAIPAERIPWDIGEPGHFEVDLVHHCGPSASGNYLHTLQMLDVATGWSERVAVLGRSYLVMKDGFERILARLPFPVLEIHPDNGSEFLNDHLLRFFQEKVTGLRLSRSRAWHKNDNRFVEQSNDSLVRAYLGYDRLDTVAQTRLLNQLYDQMGLYHNLFQPVMRLAEKQVRPSPEGRPSKIVRRFDQAQTPFDRLCALGGLSPEHQSELTAWRARSNPRALRRAIYDLLDQLWALPLADPTVSEDVFLTLFRPLDSSKGGGGSVTLSNERTVALR